MWKDLRSRLERWGLLAPLSDRLTLGGRVRGVLLAGMPSEEDDGTVLSVTVGAGKRRPFAVDAHGYFSLNLPLNEVTLLTIARPGHFPRMVKIQPMRSNSGSTRDPGHVHCTVDMVLTPRLDPHGAAIRPLRERITMPKDNRPLIAEWDFVMRAEPGEEFVPLFARVM